MNRLDQKLTIRYGRSPQFWRLRSTAKSCRSRLSSGLFRARYTATDTARDASAARFLLANASLPVLVGAVLLGLFALLQHEGEKAADAIGLGAVADSSYDVLMQTVAGTTGVFLALYFTAVSAVAATVYSSVPHDIRSLIVRDRLGNVYVRGVAFTMALSVALLVVRAVDGTAYVLALPVVGALGVFSIFAFIRLGQRAFYLADPTLLADTLLNDFNGWLRRVVQGGWKWDDPDLQKKCRVQAAKDVSSLASLLTISSEQTHLRGSSTRSLTFKIAFLLRNYLSQQNRIPSSSAWFGERYEHRQWYLASTAELTTASTTASQLQPRVVPDAHWVEFSLLTPVVIYLRRVTEADQIEEAFFSTQAVSGVAEAFGSTWAVDEGIRWLEEVTEAVLPSVVARPPTRPLVRPALLPGLLDALASFPLALELGFHRAALSVDGTGSGERIEQTDWASSSAPFAFGFPRPVVRALEQVTAGRRFESEVGAPPTARTPGWYARELAFQSLEWEFDRISTAITRTLADWYPAVADRLMAAGHYEATGAVLTRGWETVWKLERHVVEWEALIEAIRAMPIRVDFTRPVWDWTVRRARIQQLRLALVERFASSIPHLVEVDRDEQMPDYLGHAVHLMGEECFSALHQNDTALFAKLFGAYFHGITAVVDRLRPQMTEWQPQTAVTWLSEPMLDLLDLSGYASIFSEFHQDQASWDACRSTWMGYLDGSDAMNRLSVIAAMHSHQRQLFAISPRSVLRTQWQMAANQALGSLPKRETPGRFYSSEADHPSALIRSIAPSDDLMSTMSIEASDLFIVQFLSKIPGAMALDFGVADWVVEEIEGTELGDDDAATAQE